MFGLFRSPLKRREDLLNAFPTRSVDAREAFFRDAKLLQDAPHVRERLFFDPETNAHWRVIDEDIGHSSRTRFMPVNDDDVESVLDYYARTTPDMTGA